MPAYYQIRPEGETDENEWITVAADTLPQVVGSLDADTYEVRALGASDWSDPVVVTANANAAPAAPTGLTATPGDTVVNLAWTPSATTGQNAPTGHRVYRNTSDSFGGATQVGSDLGAAASSFQDTGRTNGVEYFYWVTAFNGFDESDPSTGDSATPVASAGIELVQSKSNTSGSSNSSDSITVSLDAAPTEGNLLVAVVSANSTSVSFSVPSGWTEAIRMTAASVDRFLVVYKIAGASESASVTLTGDANRHLSATVLEISGLPSAVMDISFKSQSSAGIATINLGPTAETAVANEFAVAVIAGKGDLAWGNAWTNDFVQRSAMNTGTGAAQTVATKVLSATGTVSTQETRATADRHSWGIATFRAAA